MIDTTALVNDFLKVAALAGADVPAGALTVEAAHAPHVPPSSLPYGKMAVYVFCWGEKCLKVGKAGPRSRARYTSHHYLPGSSGSNLAKSLLHAGVDLELPQIQETEVGLWVRNNADRYNFLLERRCGIATLTLLEAFLQCRLQPVFEGFISQR
jgi:hypothetical protein